MFQPANDPSAARAALCSRGCSCLANRTLQCLLSYLHPLLKEMSRYSKWYGKQTSSSISPSHYLNELQQQRCFSPLGLFNFTDHSSYFLARYSAAIKHFDKKHYSTTHQYLSQLSLNSVLEEEISVIDLDGFLAFMDNLLQWGRARNGNNEHQLM